MGLLRKHMLDHAGRKVPVYRTGLWPGVMSRECPLTPAARDRVLAKSGSGWSPVVAWSVLTLGVVMVGVASLMVYGFIRHSRVPWVGAVPMLGAMLVAMRQFAVWVVGNWTGYGAVGVDKLKGVMLDAGRCPSCGYELAGQESCPECAAAWGARK